jgi:uncharacterized membrane protein
VANNSFAGILIVYAALNILSQQNAAPLRKKLTSSKEVYLLVAGALLSTWIVFDYLTRIKGSISAPTGVVPKDQLQYILKNPWQFLVLTYDTIPNVLGLPALWQALGWFDFSPSHSSKELWFFLYRSLLYLDGLILIITVGVAIRKTAWQRICVILGFIGFGAFSAYLVSALSVFSMYLYWTKVGLDRVDGVQYRYFLPTCILFLGLIMTFCRALVMNASRTDSETLTISDSHERGIKGAYWLFAAALFSASILYISSLSWDMLKRYY